MKNIYKDIDSKKYIEQFSKEETILNLFDAIKLNNYIFDRIERTYTFDDDRCGLIIQMVDKNTRRLSRVIIDIKHGEPTYRQLLDLTFDIGNDCDHKIAVFDRAQNEMDKSDPSANEYLADNLGWLLNFYEVSIHLVSARALLKAEGEIEFEFRHLQGYKELYENLNLELPSKREFEIAEFWTVYYDAVPGIDPSFIFKPEYWMYYCPYREFAGLKITPTWTDKGFFMNVITETNSELLEWLLEYKEDKMCEFTNEFQARFESIEGVPACGSQVIVDKKSGVLQKLSVMLTDKPFKEIIYSSPEEKKEFAGIVYSMVANFAEFIDELIGSRESDKKSVND